MKHLLIILSLVTSFSSYATWSGVTNGIIKNVDVTSAENYGFRIALEDHPKLCGNEHTWAYLNKSDSNYETYVAVILAAHMSQKPIIIYTRRKNSEPNGYCHIGYVTLFN